MNKKISLILLIAFIAFDFAFISCTDNRKHSVEYEMLTKQYNDGLKIAYDKNNAFCPEATLAFCDTVIASPATNDAKRRVALFFKAVSLLKIGDEVQSIKILEALEKIGGDESDKITKDTHAFLALAYLRLGERNNCINNHASGSCIFPIEGNGVYMDESNSQKGIAVYEKILQKDPTDYESRWLLNIAYMTVGGYPKNVPAQFSIPGLDNDTSSYKVKPFTDAAGSLKLGVAKNMSGGTIIDDFNNDGYLDIVTSSVDLEDSMHYYRNNADGTFTDIAVQSGLNKIKGGLNIIQADYNNDGYKDILVLRGAWYGEFGKQPNTLLKNNGDGTFTDVTIESGLLSLHPTQTGVWADFNNDGWLDLFIGNETMTEEYLHPSELFINNQDGTFTNVTKQAGAAFTGFMKGVVSADYNNDGWPDIFISMMDGKKLLLKIKQ
jgi:hypothetical protein